MYLYIYILYVIILHITDDLENFSDDSDKEELLNYSKMKKQKHRKRTASQIKTVWYFLAT